MGSKVRLFVTDYEVLDVPVVHADGDPRDGDGTLCGVKYGDYLAPHSYTHAGNGVRVFEATSDTITCKACIATIEACSNYKKTKGGYR